ncbi:sensor histidine kinase [Peredibacter starrii]|uniref:histidine kinase n=1 Tax=Peredibacter starrii TaxID=28202 RepID=A0AAX4HUD4_9BACT|nr:MHYT domain-containing protein [Peredibacter starrii]WPU66570.1 MHYT domain-containing protein [Peredibacter starrii]
MSHLHHEHDIFLMVLSVIIAMFASYTALDLSNAVSTVKGRIRWFWLAGGSFAMGVGIWSMHFVAMLAFKVEGLTFYYDVPLLGLSMAASVFGSLLSLLIVSTGKPTIQSYLVGSCVMGAAISSMHFIAIKAMKMEAGITWNYFLVILSIVISILASGLGLHFAFLLKRDYSFKGFIYRVMAGIILGIAIAGMHYTAMAAMYLHKVQSHVIVNPTHLLAADGLAGSVIIATILILGFAITGTNLELAIMTKQKENETLESSIRIRDHFVSLASHELKAPLTSIKLQNDLIMRSIKKQDVDLNKMEGMLSRTGKNVERINRLVDDMLDVSRMDSGKLTLQKENAELSTILSEVIERLLPMLESAGCPVFYHFMEEYEGNWDRFRLEQVFTNILINAAKYAPGKPIEVSIREYEDMAMVSIRDHGKGIPPEFAEKIFDKFERAKNEGDAKGLGLGLFISREIIHLHDGKIQVKSTPGEGSDFQIFLPVLRPSQTFDGIFKQKSTGTHNEQSKS